MKRLSLITLLLIASFAGYGQQNRGLTGADRPDMVMIYADDLCYGDLSCYRSAGAGATRLATPRIDRLVRSGLRFTRAYATST